MSREIPKVPTIFPVRSRSGSFVVETQRTSPSGPGLLLLDVHQRLAGADDLLLVAQRLRRVLVGEEVEVGPPDGERRARDAEARRRVPVDAREAALPILEVDAVGDVVHQRLQQEDLVLEVRDLGDDGGRAGGDGRLAAGFHAHGSPLQAPPPT